MESREDIDFCPQRSEYMDIQEERGQRVHNGHYGDFNRDIKVDYGMGIS